MKNNELRKRRKKYILVIAVIGSLSLFLFIFLCKKNRVDEFDYQQCMTDDISDEMRAFYYDFDRCCTMNYEDYAMFCNKYGYEQKYDDMEKYYVVYAYYFMGMSFFDVKSIYYYDDKILINTKEHNWGATGNITSRMIVIPVEKSIADDKILLKNKFIANNYN